MTILVRYMYGRLMIATLAIMVLLAGHEMFYKTKDLYRLVLSNVITVNELMIVWAALMPVVVYHISPQMVAIALLARYYLWRQHNEVLTFRTMGLSCWQIALPGIATGACMALFAASMSLYALPRSVSAGESIRAVAQTRIAPHMLEEGVPNIIVPGLSISFDRWLSADVVEKVVLTDDRKPDEFRPSSTPTAAGSWRRTEPTSWCSKPAPTSPVIRQARFSG